jgi:disulfide oxidoreductase YuzD
MDTQNHTGMIAVYNNWDKQTGRHEPSKANKVHVYNTTKEAIESQIKSVKGFKKWKGQIFFWFDDDDYIYPVSLVDPVIYDADTEKQISLFKNGELRRGFFLKYIIHHTSFTNPKDAEDFKEKLGKVMGGGHEYSSLVMDGEFDADGNLKDGPNIKITKIDQNVSDKLFDTYEKSTTNNIRKAFHAIPQILIDYEDSKLGTTSGEALRQAAEFYNSQTEDTRKNIGQCFQQIMKNWKDDMTNETFNIKPLSLGTTVEL